MDATTGYKVDRFQERDGSWLYTGVVRDLVTGRVLWSGPLTDDCAAAEHGAREMLAILATQGYAGRLAASRAGVQG